MTTLCVTPVLGIIGWILLVGTLVRHLNKEALDVKALRLASLDPNDHPIGWKRPEAPPSAFKQHIREILDDEDRRSVERLKLTFYRCPDCTHRGSHLTLEDIRKPCGFCNGYSDYRSPND